MENKKEYAVSYYGGHVSAWLCVVVAILGIMYLLLGRGGGTKSMMVALFFHPGPGFGSGKGPQGVWRRDAGLLAGFHVLCDLCGLLYGTCCPLC